MVPGESVTAARGRFQRPLEWTTCWDWGAVDLLMVMPPSPSSSLLWMPMLLEPASSCVGRARSPARWPWLSIAPATLSACASPPYAEQFRASE